MTTKEFPSKHGHLNDQDTCPCSPTVYRVLQIIRGGKFHRFHRSIGKRETFTVKPFHFDNRVLQMAGHSPGSFLNCAERIPVIYIPPWGRSLEYCRPPKTTEYMVPTCLIKLISTTMLKWHEAYYFISFAYRYNIGISWVSQISSAFQPFPNDR